MSKTSRTHVHHKTHPASRDKIHRSLQSRSPQARQTAHSNFPIEARTTWTRFHSRHRHQNRFQPIQVRQTRTPIDCMPNGTPKTALVSNSSQIQITDAATGEVIQIPSKRANDPHKTLGHWKAPADHLQKQQLAALTTKANSITTLICISQLSRFGSTLAYHGTYIPSMKYVLPQCFFEEKALDKAERQSLPPLIAKCGYNRKIAIGLRYAPLSYAGCGFVRWSTMQGEGQVTLFLKHW